MTEYEIEVERDGRWWMIRVPEIDQLTQARRIDEIEDMARSLIAISTDQPINDITVQNIATGGPLLSGGIVHHYRARRSGVGRILRAVAPS
ncbi:hypothetical protein [Mycobacterium xenopi]|uniref:HicB family toxin-antitoxin system n=2 Tax=Mycobacterium xenopi TaxID=1789 RepID=A0AAD1M1W3_MYCXE|nr:hypothetical protein [Mycobacterium xenopi]MDA3639827.1 hypothetical protein [Mycobacterium xenopi]MDA3658187.1 hypothetical protein [Mycobacterium xenopi]MDA3661839.1 hypothetical protein [Mycobacterium xenopi]ORX21441.1 hypothetical protein AWC32_23310 [Mycobacterium xenopi]SPX88920.1 Conserved protein of uncharacterised function; putative phage protein [Mycobacterium xenopi]